MSTITMSSTHATSSVHQQSRGVTPSELDTMLLAYGTGGYRCGSRQEARKGPTGIRDPETNQDLGAAYIVKNDATGRFHLYGRYREGMQLPKWVKLADIQSGKYPANLPLEADSGLGVTDGRVHVEILVGAIKDIAENGVDEVSGFRVLAYIKLVEHEIKSDPSRQVEKWDPAMAAEFQTFAEEFTAFFLH